jgi:hypothetical protein
MTGRRKQLRVLSTSKRSGVTSVRMPLSDRWLGQFGYTAPVRGLGRVAFLQERTRTSSGGLSEAYCAHPMRAVVDDFGDLVAVERMPVPVSRWWP